MITFIPKSLSGINSTTITAATPLEQPVSQIGRLDVAADVSFIVDEHLFTTPSFQGFLQLIEAEHYSWRYVVGGGRDADERRLAAAWAFLPLSKGAQVTLDDLLDDDRRAQSLVQSKKSVVAPTLRALRAVTNDRPGAKPALQMIEPKDSDTEADDEVDDGI